jgi:hypothetical protein
VPAQRSETADSFQARDRLSVGDASYDYYRIDAVAGSARLPFSLKVLLENLLRAEDGKNVTAEQIQALADWRAEAEPTTEIQFTPARVVMQDFTGVPAIVDLATMREAMGDLGGDPAKINPLAPAELVIDHSVIADLFGVPDAFERNVELEYQRNRERYQFLRWGQTAFDEFKVVPPGPASSTRSTSSTWPASSSPGTASPIPTRWSARIRIPRWSTGSACWAGASAASRPRRPCSASRSACSSPVSSASNSPASCPTARRPPTSS